MLFTSLHFFFSFRARPLVRFCEFHGVFSWFLWVSLETGLRLPRRGRRLHCSVTVAMCDRQRARSERKHCCSQLNTRLHSRRARHMLREKRKKENGSESICVLISLPIHSFIRLSAFSYSIGTRFVIVYHFLSLRAAERKITCYFAHSQITNSLMKMISKIFKYFMNLLRAA